MPLECFFEFERGDPIYYSGETIRGQIILTTTCEKNVNGKHAAAFLIVK